MALSFRSPTPRENCVSCGKFISVNAPGVSGSQTWGYDMSGCPDLHDPRYRCAPCTDRLGPMTTNCKQPDYAWVNPSK